MDWTEFIAEHVPTPDTVTVEAYSSGGYRGPVLADAVTVTPCVVEDVQRQVKVQTQDAAGSVQLASTTVWMPPGTVCPPGSMVTANGRRAKVIAASKLSGHGHDVPDHLEVSLE